MAEFFASDKFAESLRVIQNEVPFAIWETFYATVLSTLFAIIIGLPLGVLLVVGEKRRSTSASSPDNAYTQCYR